MACLDWSDADPDFLHVLRLQQQYAPGACEQQGGMYQAQRTYSSEVRTRRL